MQDKIDEIMGLVDAYAKKVERSVSSGDASVKFLAEECEARKAIESKLRDLVREPLTEQEISIVFDKTEDESEYGTYDFGFFKDFTRNIERTHNITNTSGEV